MEYIFNLAFAIILLCTITFFVGVIKLFQKKDSNAKAIKMIIFSLLIIVITLLIGVSVCFSTLSLGRLN